MDLKTYLTPMSGDERIAFADKCGTTRGHLQNVMYGVKSCAPGLARTIETVTGGSVTRQELRPDDFSVIWPELASEAA